MAFKVKAVEDKFNADRVIAFLISKNAFDLEMTEFRQKKRKETVYRSLQEENHQFWYIEDNSGNIITAGGVAENESKTGGYFLDYFAVHKAYRRKGLGTKILQEVEQFVKSKNGRYIIIETGDTEQFKSACEFYKKHGFDR